jgi:hypothetical protein
MTKKTKIFLLVFTGFIALTVLPVTAQSQGDGYSSEFYYVNVPVEKVYAYRKGYIVSFRQSGISLGQAYIPYEWFRVDNRKAELIDLPSGKNWPSMTVFYTKGGGFHSVRLYVSKQVNHVTWGYLPSATNLDDRFEGVESIDLGIGAKK